ncbi:MAG: FeoB-associated Cys-rich membrane protein [Roseburia sp.]|nr:FeoB-associated Cys-rich membrane protein [Roseburia sp.]
MSIGTIATLAVVAAAVGLAVRSMIRDKRSGKSLQCGGDCSHCGGHCH